MTQHKPENATSTSAADSRPATAGGGDIPDDPQALAEDIERTRHQVGDSVAALTAKLDVKAQLKDTAGRMKDRVSAVTGEVTGKITDKAGAAEQLRGTAAKVTHAADEQRIPFAVAAGGLVLLAGAWLTWVIRRRR
jgi:ABC-type transporter Mla subunit MlaD